MITADASIWIGYFQGTATPHALVGNWCIRNDCDLFQNDRGYDGMVAFMGLKGMQ